MWDVWMQRFVASIVLAFSRRDRVGDVRGTLAEPTSIINMGISQVKQSLVAI